jgi:hypothetical protein
MRQAIQHPEADRFVRDADLGLIAQQRLTRCGMQQSPAFRRRLGTVRVVDVDLLARDLDAEVCLYGLGHLGGGVKARQALDDERLYFIGEDRHRFFIL